MILLYNFGSIQLLLTIDHYRFFFFQFVSQQKSRYCVASIHTYAIEKLPKLLPTYLKKKNFFIKLLNIQQEILLCFRNRRDLQRTASSGSLSYPESPEFTMRPRALSNASSCGGRLSPAMSSVPPRPRPLSNASSTATLEVGGGNGGGVIAGPPPANTTGLF